MEEKYKTEWTLLAGDFLAKILAVQEAGTESTVIGQVFSTNSSEYVATYNQCISSWKTVPSSSQEESKPYWVKFPKWGTMRNGAVWERQKLGRGTDENDGGACVKRTLFPTVNVNGIRGGAHTDKTLLVLRNEGKITEEERIAMGGRREFPNMSLDDLSVSYGSKKALKGLFK